MEKPSIPENELLTVIVPIYNTAQYLSKCIESIICQQYKQLDVILFDDGSIDGSGEICDEFSHMDERIRVFHRKNQGLVAARKQGVELAKGDLITFVDSDDWIEPDMYSQIMDVYMEYKPDMVTSGLIIENNNKINYEIERTLEGLYDYDDIRENLIPCMMYDELEGKRAITSSVCNKVYKAGLLKEIVLALDENITYGEDAAITYLYIARASRIVVLSNSWYHYIIHSGSMVRHYDINSFQRIYQFHNYMKKKFSELGIWGQMETQVKKYTKIFLFQAMQEVFDILVEKPTYLFPFELIEKGSRVIIYGAGKVGTSYRESLLKSGYAKLQRWVDQNYEELDAKGYTIDSPDVLCNEETDYVVIAMKNREVTAEVKVFLEKLGIEESKVIWKPPIRLN